MNNINKKLLQTFDGNILPTPPIWLMRQAGRYLAEYRQVRQEVGSFLELCYTPSLASEVTLQPIRRFSFDAAIIFSDILVIPDALGVTVQFKQGEGPVLNPIQSKNDLNVLNLSSVTDHLQPVYEAIKLTKSQLPQETTLIGFAGSPFTVACYMVEGKASKDFAKVRQFAYEESKSFTALLDILVEATILHLKNQITAGAEVIQLFESWAGVVPANKFYEWVIEPTSRIVQAIKATSPHIPIIGFPKGAGMLFESYVHNTQVDGVSVDYATPIKKAVEIAKQKQIVLQGNLDPVLLATNSDAAMVAVDEILYASKEIPFIFNLGHGIIPTTPVKHVEKLVTHIKKMETLAA